MIFTPCHELSHLLRPPPSWIVTFFMDGPRGRIATSALSSCAGTVKHTPDCTVSVMNFQKISKEGLTEKPPQTPPPAHLGLRSRFGLRPHFSSASRPWFGLRPQFTPPPNMHVPQHSVRNCSDQKLVTLEKSALKF